MINTVCIAGYLGQAPELSCVGSEQKEVANFSVAVKGYGDKTTWVKCVAWGKLALFCGTYLKKGAFVVLHGRLEQETWEEPDGTKRSILKVIADAVESPKKD
jgi:single-strand DNA-binding protein